MTFLLVMTVYAVASEYLSTLISYRIKLLESAVGGFSKRKSFSHSEPLYLRRVSFSNSEPLPLAWVCVHIHMR